MAQKKSFSDLAKLEEGTNLYNIADKAYKDSYAARKTLSKWMTQFFSISKDAFKEEPQMLEALGIVTKK
jgi:hypothetical protein